MRGNFIPILLLVAILGSCKGNRIFEAYHSIDKASWHFHDTAIFSVNIEDTSHYYHWMIMLRHQTGYRYSNAYVMLETTGPNGFGRKETFDIMIAEADGKWVGRRSGGLVEVVQPFWVRRQMPDTGTYVVKIYPYMRMDEVPQITDVGLQVMKGEPVY